MNITVLSSGGWGTALALLLLDSGHDVTLWSHSQEGARWILHKRENPYLQGVYIPEALHITSTFDSLPTSELVVFATPSFAIRETARKCRDHLRPGAVLVTVSKGIEPETFLTATQIIAQEAGGGHPIAALSGPSHAEEVSRKIPTGVVAASADLAAAEWVQDAFMTPAFRVYTNADVTGVELGGALKNVYAVCCGVSDGMGLGDNTKALLMTRALSEMSRLGEAMGGRRDTFAGLAGMGDLIVTCTSMHSRNRRCGILVGQGKSVREAIREVGATVEGYYAAASAAALAAKMGVEMPICQSAYGVLYQDLPVSTVVEGLMTRQRKPESNG